MQVLREAAPDLFVQGSRAAVLTDRLVQLLAVLLVAQWLPRGTDDGERRRQEPLQSEVVERGDELALGEIAGAAEDDDRRGLGDAREPQPFSQRVECRGGQPLFLLDCVAAELIPQRGRDLHRVAVLLT